MFNKVASKIYPYLSDRIQKRLQREAAYRVAKRFFADHKDPEVIRKLIESQRYRFGIKPTQMEIPQQDHILVLAPHQDDETIGPGGTIIRCVNSGKRVKAVYITNGAAETSQNNSDHYAEIRKAEAIKVWEYIGGEPPSFMGLPARKDNNLREESAGKLSQLISEFKAQCIFVPFFLDPAVDHRLTNQLLLMAYQMNRLSDLIQIWAYQTSAVLFPNVVVDISELIDKKVKVNSLWESQNKTFNYAHFSKGMSAYNSILLERREKPNPQEKYAELFFVANTNEYLELVNEYTV